MGCRVVFPYVPYYPHRKQAIFLSDRANAIEEILFGGAAGGGKSDAILTAALQFVHVPGYAALILRKTFRQLKLPGSILDRAHLWLRRHRYVKDDNGRLLLSPGQVAPGARANIAEWARPGAGKTLEEWGLVRWNAGDYRFEFPSGATLTFGHLQNEDDKLNYQGPEFQFVAFDELTQFTETQYTYLASRLRQPEPPACVRPDGHRGPCRHLRDAKEEVAPGGECSRTLEKPAEDAEISELWQVPLRLRSGSNPGGSGHKWVKRRFIGDPAKGIPRGEATARFIPSTLDDNPSLGKSYEAALAKLDRVTFRQLRYGSWDEVKIGELFQRGDYRMVEPWEVAGLAWDIEPLRYWDLAATEGDGSNDPDWVVGAKVGYAAGYWYILDIARFRGDPGPTEQFILTTMRNDGASVAQFVEQEPGASGKMVVASFIRAMPGHIVDGHRPSGDKVTRAKVVSAKVSNHLVRVLNAHWNDAYFEEAEEFPNASEHDDQVDAVSGAFDRINVGAGTATTDDTATDEDTDEDDVATIIARYS